MSPSLHQLTQAVIERIMAQAPQRRPYPQHRRAPRAYIKSLKDTSRTVPAVALPTGPMPDEPWYDPHEDEAEVPLIGEAFLAYEKEHSHRTRMSKYQIERAVSAFLDHANLHDNEPIWTITREACKNWRTSLMNGDSPTRRGRKPNPVTVEKRLKMVEHFMKWCVEREYLSSNPMQGLFRMKNSRRSSRSF